jgi:hypothetical protein
MSTTMTTRYFTSSISGALFRKGGEGDQVFVVQNGTWRPTEKIMRWMLGSADEVDEVTEAQARAFAPKAFT